MDATLSRPQYHCQNRRSAMSVWVYFLGEKTGADINVGHSKERTLRKRLQTINKTQMTSDEYVLLAAVHATTKDEDYIKERFAEYLRPKGYQTEYFRPA